MMKKGDFGGARELFKIAMEVDPYNGLYRASAGWAHFCDPKLDPAVGKDRAYALVKEGALLTRKDAMVQLYLGEVLADRGQFEAARDAFEIALQLDPANPGAKRGLAGLPAAEGKKKETKQSALSKLIKR